jgi:hypothetical protein
VVHHKGDDSDEGSEPQITLPGAMGRKPNGERRRESDSLDGRATVSKSATGSRVINGCRFGDWIIWADRE